MRRAHRHRRRWRGFGHHDQRRTNSAPLPAHPLTPTALRTSPLALYLTRNLYRRFAIYTKVARKSKKKSPKKKKKKPTKGLSSTTGCHPRLNEAFARFCAARKNRARKTDTHQKCRATTGIFRQLERHTCEAGTDGRKCCSLCQRGESWYSIFTCQKDDTRKLNS